MPLMNNVIKVMRNKNAVGGFSTANFDFYSHEISISTVVAVETYFISTSTWLASE